MNVRKLSTSGLLDLLAVVNCGGFNRAAQELNMSQSSLTRSIKRLEENLGVELLVRTKNGVHPTVYGEVLVSHARSIEHELRDGLERISDLTVRSITQLSIGMSPTVAYKIGPAAVAATLRGQAKVSVRLIEALKPALLTELGVGRIDIFVAMQNPREDLQDIVVEELFTDEVAFIVRGEHPLARRRKRISAKEFAMYSWVLPDDGAHLRRRLEERIAAEGLQLPRNTVSTGSINATKAFVLESNRIAALPLHVIGDELKDGRMVKLESDWDAMFRRFCIYRRANEPFGGGRAVHVKRFIDHLRRAGPAQMADGLV